MKTDHLPRHSAVRATYRPLAWSLAASALLALVLAAAAQRPDARAEVKAERLTSRPATSAPAIPAAAIGDLIQTRAGERRRLALAGGSILYVNENTQVKLAQASQLELTVGEVYVETSSSAGGTPPLVVQAPRREVSARGSSFAVRTAAAGTAVLVTRGQVQVAGLDQPLRSGQQLAAGGTKAAPAPRASLLLDWTRELRLAAESPLVPGSNYAGGALVAVNPEGQQTKLTLRRYHIDVHIEDGFARTTIDQTYFNDSLWQMEGTFYFPLPPDASLSQLAMYVDGNLMEGGMVERDLARSIYETIRYRQRDPALLEWLDGSTFKMRVFPIEPRQEKRLLLSYTQKLSSVYGQTQYRFPAGHSLPSVRDWSFHARLKDGAALAWASPSHALKAGKDRTDLVLDGSASKARFDRDVVLLLGEPILAAKATENVRWSLAEQDGSRYLMVRFRPDLLRPSKNGEQAVQARQPRSYVFLFESSGDRDPLLARVQIEVIRGLLAQAEADDTFTVLTAGTRVRTLDKELRPVTAENVQQALAFLEGSHLIGALDLGQALSEAESILKKAGNAYLVHVGSGIAAMGERREDVLSQRIPAGTRYVGVGVGRRWGRSFMKAAAERSGGYFTQINPDEPISWRVFELSSTLQTLAANPAGGVEVLLPPGCCEAMPEPSFLYYSRSLAPGEELCAITRLDGKDELPAEVTVRFTEKEQVTVPLRNVAGKAAYLPRMWAKLEIDRLLAEDAVQHKAAIIALSKAMYVMTPYTSLLVLENEDMYTQYKVERNRQDRWAAYPCPPKIPVVYEPDPDVPDFKALKAGQKLPARQLVKTILLRQPPRLLAGAPDEGKEVEKMPTGSVERVFFGTTLLGRAGTPAGLEPLTVIDMEPAAIEPGTDIEYGADRRAPAASRESARLMRETALQAQLDTKKKRFDLEKYIRDNTPFEDSSREMIAGGFASAAPLGGTFFGRSGHTSETRVRLDQIRRPTEVDWDHYSSWLEGSKVFDITLRYKPDSEGSSSLLYQRPGFSGQDRIFYDLVAYAPGMSTSLSDVAAVIEAEALPTSRRKSGRIDPDARILLEKARPTGWQTLTLPAEGSQPGCSIAFDGQGRYAYQRLLAPGFREQVICDGQALLHLYPQLGLGARRTVSRFHRAAFFSTVPWALPTPEDLAHGADLKTVGPRTVAIVPHGADTAKDAKGKAIPYLRSQLVFAEDGSLAERQVVRLPEGKVLLRLVCTTEGGMRLLDKDGKELAASRGRLTPGKQPDLSPNAKALVVLPLPYRSRQYLVRTLKLDGKAYTDMRFADALQLLASDFAAGNSAEMLKVFREAFHGRDQRQLGFYVLLAAAGHSLDSQNVDVLAEHPDEPLAQYLTLHTSAVLRTHAAQWAVSSVQWGEPVLQHLAQTHALFQRWSDDRVLKGNPARVKAERQRALEYVRRNKDSAFGWALLGLLQDRAGQEQFPGELADAFQQFEDQPGLGYVARYERARSLYRSGERQQARKLFRELYERTLKDEVLPAIDTDFRAALQGDADTPDLWSEVLRQTAERLVRQKHRPAVLALAKQAWQLQDPSLANQLVALALAGVAEEKQRVPLTLAGIEFFKETSQLPQADELLSGLLADAKLAKRADLWRLAAQIAGQRDMPGRSLECLERALDAEFQKLPEVVDLQTVRQEYGKVLDHYQSLVQAMHTLKIRAPEGFAARVIRTADRWRALDQEATTACQAAARILRSLGEREVGWDYLTTPIAWKPAEAEPWQELAQTLRRTGDLALAERAYKAAVEAEPTNADLLWERAENLRQAGKAVEARQLFRQIADGRWQPRFQPTQARARSLLSGAQDQ